MLPVQKTITSCVNTILAETAKLEMKAGSDLVLKPLYKSIGHFKRGAGFLNNAFSNWNALSSVDNGGGDGKIATGATGINRIRSSAPKANKLAAAENK